MTLKSEFSPLKRDPRHSLLTEINVTPFVDVMLVLLVIFMVTAPLLTTGVEVDLPDARARQIASDGEPLQISIDRDQTIYLGSSAIPREEFANAVAQLALTAEDPSSQRVFVRADQSVAYGDVMLVVSQIGDAGFTRVAFISDDSGRQAQQERR